MLKYAAALNSHLCLNLAPNLDSDPACQVTAPARRVAATSDGTFIHISLTFSSQDNLERILSLFYTDNYQILKVLFVN